MEHYNFKLSEQKWQNYWEKNNSFVFDLNSGKPKFYMLSMFPYPSGDLHIGHVRNYSMSDAIARFKRMKGFNVLHPMGADAFGLPAENAAIKRGINPKDWTEQNIQHFITAMKKLGLSFDWSRFFATCREDYYKHQQKIFLELYKKGLVYQKESYVNWDPVDNTVLANEQVIDGRGWRSGAIVEKKQLKQWYFKITHYAEELLNDIEDKLQGWTEKVKTMQKNWIGKSQGVLIQWEIVDNKSNIFKKVNLKNKMIDIYTTRPDTIFGASFIALAFDHPLVLSIAENNEKLKEFINEAKKDSIDEETMNTKEKKGIYLGFNVKNPLDESIEVPVYSANFILMNYGTGAIFGCPAHDQRDFEFATKYKLPILKVIDCDNSQLPYCEYGTVVNSKFLNGLTSQQAKQEVIKKLKEVKKGEEKTIYRMRDWSFSRQRYWGCPIPIVYCNKCGVVLEKEENLPVKLPENVVFDGKGSPLAKHPSWKYTKCPCCGEEAIRETDTMDTFVDSSWYMLRYVNLLDNKPVDKENCDKMFPIDLYIGGAEHATMHLLYFRFFTKAMRDCGMITIDEPCKNLYNQGMVCHKAYRGIKTKEYCFPWNIEKKENGEIYSKETGEQLECEGIVKMSKSKLNVVDTATVLDIYGADATRMFLLSDSPANKDFEWTEEGLESCWKYIDRMYRLVNNFDKNYAIADATKYSNEIIKLVHKTIKDVENNFENIEFNRAIAKIRELTNFIEKLKLNSQEEKESYNFAVATFIKLFTPFAPHFANEMAEIVGIDNSIWPKYSNELTVDEIITIAIQVNGKLRATINCALNSNQEQVEQFAKLQEKVKKYLENAKIKNVIFIKNKLINFVIDQ